MSSCKICKSKEVRTRTNYPHGKNGRSVTTSVCKECGSSEIEKSQNKNWNHSKWQRR